MLATDCNLPLSTKVSWSFQLHSSFHFIAFVLLCIVASFPFRKRQLRKLRYLKIAWKGRNRMVVLSSIRWCEWDAWSLILSKSSWLVHGIVCEDYYLAVDAQGKPLGFSFSLWIRCCHLRVPSGYLSAGECCHTCAVISKMLVVYGNNCWLFLCFSLCLFRSTIELKGLCLFFFSLHFPISHIWMDREPALTCLHSTFAYLCRNSSLSLSVPCNASTTISSTTSRYNWH